MVRLELMENIEEIQDSQLALVMLYQSIRLNKTSECYMMLQEDLFLRVSQLMKLSSSWLKSHKRKLVPITFLILLQTIQEQSDILIQIFMLMILLRLI